MDDASFMEIVKKNNWTEHFFNGSLTEELFNLAFDDQPKIHVESIVLVTLYVPVFIVGILGNGLLAFLVLSKSHLRNVTNIFLLNMAIADLSGRSIFI